MPTSATTSTHKGKERKLKKPTATANAQERKDSRHSTKGSSKGTSKASSPVPPNAHHNIMSAATASSAAASPSSDTTYYLVPNLQALDPSAGELDASAHAWVQPTVIEDDDLTFGGKSLSAWYEEDRRRFSYSDGEEEHRGRERVRRSYNDKNGGKK